MRRPLSPHAAGQSSSKKVREWLSVAEKKGLEEEADSADFTGSRDNYGKE
jgi:hypothetical protein